MPPHHATSMYAVATHDIRRRLRPVTQGDPTRGGHATSADAAGRERSDGAVRHHSVRPLARCMHRLAARKTRGLSRHRRTRQPRRLTSASRRWSVDRNIPAASTPFPPHPHPARTPSAGVGNLSRLPVPRPRRASTAVHRLYRTVFTPCRGPPRRNGRASLAGGAAKGRDRSPPSLRCCGACAANEHAEEGLVQPFVCPACVPRHRPCRGCAPRMSARPAKTLPRL
jgi:hypothetical protein